MRRSRRPKHRAPRQLFEAPRGSGVYRFVLDRVVSDPTFLLAVRHRGVLTVREVEPAFARTLFQDPEFLDGKGRLGETFHASGRPLPLAPREDELLVFDLDTRRVSGVVRDARFNLALLPTFQLSLQLSGILHGRGRA